MERLCLRQASARSAAGLQLLPGAGPLLPADGGRRPPGLAGVQVGLLVVIEGDYLGVDMAVDVDDGLGLGHPDGALGGGDVVHVALQPDALHLLDVLVELVSLLEQQAAGGAAPQQSSGGRERCATLTLGSVTVGRGLS